MKERNTEAALRALAASDKLTHDEREAVVTAIGYCVYVRLEMKRQAQQAKPKPA